MAMGKWAGGKSTTTDAEWEDRKKLQKVLDTEGPENRVSKMTQSQINGLIDKVLAKKGPNIKRNVMGTPIREKNGFRVTLQTSGPRQTLLIPFKDLGLVDK